MTDDITSAGAGSASNRAAGVVTDAYYLHQQRVAARASALEAALRVFSAHAANMELEDRSAATVIDDAKKFLAFLEADGASASSPYDDLGNPQNQRSGWNQWVPKGALEAVRD